MKVALVGNPNSGKTTLFNNLTNQTAYVGNWPGVTVEKKEGNMKLNKDIRIIDLPGIYSLSPYTPEEIVTREYLLNEKPDAIINIVDATNLERNLYLTTQILEMNIPTIIVLNMADVLEKNKIKLNVKHLEEQLHAPIILISALRSKGLDELAARLPGLKSQEKTIAFSNRLETIIDEIEQKFTKNVFASRFFAVKLFEKDEHAINNCHLTSDQQKELFQRISDAEKEFDDDCESIVTNERYEFLSSILKKEPSIRDTGLTISDKIDQIVTHRIFALPIFVAIMFLVYYISISTFGTNLTDWVNDVLFGEIITDAATNFLEYLHASAWVISLVVDGIIAGVGAVLGFLPQMLCLFFFLAILEDCGYMARIAFIMDRIFRKFGLSGKSFIPMLIGTGCSVPGILATRTIENESDRKMTIITTSFMPCSAKLPVIALISGAFFKDNPWISPLAYFIGMAAIILSGIILKKTSRFKGDVSPFVMELPPYRMPQLKGVLIKMYDKGKAFVMKAGTIIFLASIFIWFTLNFSFSFQMVDDIEQSMLAGIGRVFSVLFVPLGFGNWRYAVATISGLIAKENIINTFGIIFSVEVASETGEEVWGLLNRDLSSLQGLSFLVFNLLCIPCFAAIGAIRREMASASWTIFALVYQSLLAYLSSFILYQVGLLFMGQAFTAYSFAAFLLLAYVCYLLFRPAASKRLQTKGR